MCRQDQKIYFEIHGLTHSDCLLYSPTFGLDLFASDKQQIQKVKR